jgi:hypothetical protein
VHCVNFTLIYQINPYVLLDIRVCCLSKLFGVFVTYFLGVSLLAKESQVLLDRDQTLSG